MLRRLCTTRQSKMQTLRDEPQSASPLRFAPRAGNVPEFLPSPSTPSRPAVPVERTELTRRRNEHRPTGKRSRSCRLQRTSRTQTAPLSSLKSVSSAPRECALALASYFRPMLPHVAFSQKARMPTVSWTQSSHAFEVGSVMRVT
jgi:hypothetical protein